MKKLLSGILLLIFAIISGCSKSNDSNEDLSLPIVSTIIVTDITSTTASSGGSISSDGGDTVSLRGVIWSTSSIPNTGSDTKTIDGSGIGSFTSLISGLTANTTYYLRAYATNRFGTAYGNEVSFKTPNFLYSFSQGQTLSDIDGNSYSTIITNCGNQIWMQENLKVSRYRNGDIIPEVNSATWGMLKTGAWCYYNNSKLTGNTYGKLYNWYAVNDPRGLAPEGWHVPSNNEWMALSDCLGGYDVAGGKMKSTNWTIPNKGATNSSGFTALPGGIRYSLGTFYPLNSYGGWWSSTQYSQTDAWTRFLSYSNENITKGFDAKYLGFSVRCIKD